LYGNLGGGRPITIIAAALAEPSVELSRILPNVTPTLTTFPPKSPKACIRLETVKSKTSLLNLKNPKNFTNIRQFAPQSRR
jgi:hypothetical protein